MATLVLTTIGTAIGGPLGGALGALLGQAADARLFSPKGRVGPRLDELRVQTSSYGSAIPKLFGRMRVSGTVIWATELVEHRGRQSNGKGRGSTTTFSYSVSLAVALSSRPILRVGRIWAEGNILRGAAGDFKSPTGFRLHPGGEDQPIDPLIAAAEAAGACPAYRGMAYAVFEDLDLTPFGNRVPSLSFEVEADDGALTLADPVGSILSPWQAAGAVEPIAGCALAGASGEDAIRGFGETVAIDRVPGERLWSIGRGGDGLAQTLGEPVVDAQRQRGAGFERRSAGADTVPQRLSVASYDPARDFQIGIQQLRVAGGGGPGEQIALPVAMAAHDAKALAARLGMDAVLASGSVRWPQGFAALALPPGAAVTLPGADQPMTVEERRIEGAAVMLGLRNFVSAAAVAVNADGGRAAASPDLLIGVSIAHLFDLPSMDSADRAGGRLVLAAAGSGAGWRSASVAVRALAGAPAVGSGAVTRAAVLGSVESIDAGGGCALFDRQRGMTVALIDPAMELHNASDADLLAGANLAVAGNEVFQFGHAEPLGAGRWRLTRLLRGRLGSEDAVAGLAGGAGFALLSDPALLRIDQTLGASGLVGWGDGAAVLIEGQGDGAALTLPVPTAMRALRPLSPVHLRGAWQADGGLVLRWIRRSRDGFGWTDGIDAPLDERSEHYRLTFSSGAAVAVEECDGSSFALSAADVAQWRARESVLGVAVTQVGERGESVALTGIIPL